MSDTKIIELSNSNVKIGIVPEAGGSLAYFKTMLNGKEVDVMRPASEKALNDKEANNFAMYPILPYVNKIHGGFFVYWGIKRSVPRNCPFDKEPLDGDGWRNSWQVKSSSETEVVLTFTNDPKKGFPFSYGAELTYKLSPKGFSTHIVLTNQGILPMPCAMGVHPFFPKTKDVEVTLKNKNVWENMGTPLRDKPYQVSSDWSFENGKRIAEQGLDTCFGGFDGTAVIKWQALGLTLNIKAYDEFNHVILFAPENKNIFSLQPVTSATDAFNIASRGITGTGIKSIGPHESIDATIEFTVE